MAKVRKLLTQIYLNIANTCDVVSFHSLAIHVFMIWSISCTEGIHVRAFALRQDLLSRYLLIVQAPISLVMSG